MGPRRSSDDPADLVLGDAKTSRQRWLENSTRVKATDFQNVGIRQFSVVARRSASGVRISSDPTKPFKSMLGVLGWGDDLKVLNPVVVLNPVDVVHAPVSGNRADESLNDKPMHFHRALSRGGVERDAVIPVLITVSGKRFASRAEDLPASGHTIIGPIANEFALRHQPSPAAQSVTQKLVREN